MTSPAFRPDLSVVVPVLNGEPYLRWTLQCLADLDGHLRCEVIIQDAGSTDNTGLLAREYCRDRPLWSHHVEPDAGQSDAINRGMARTTGRWVTWLCADDLLLPAVAGLLAEADRAGADIVYGDVFFVPAAGVIPATGTETHGPGSLARCRLIIQQPGTCIRREVWMEANGVDVGLNWTMDYDLFLRLESAGRRFCRVRSFAALARLHPEAKTSSGSIKRLAELWRVLWAAHRRRPRFFRPQPYLLYFLEYLIKRLEAGPPGPPRPEGPKSPRSPRSPEPLVRRRLLPGLHGLFWLVARPGEEADIRHRFAPALAAATLRLQALGVETRPPS